MPDIFHDLRLTAHLRTGVCVAALTAMIASPALAGDYSAGDATLLQTALTNAAAATEDSIVALTGDITAGVLNLPAPAHNVTIDTGSFTLSRTYSNSTTLGVLAFAGPYTSTTYTLKGIFQAGDAGAVNAAGGQGLYVNTGAAVINDGAITGGAGGSLGNNGGIGAAITNSASLTNNGYITGGFGTAGAGGAGASIQNGGILTNNGVIRGGDGLTGGIGVSAGTVAGTGTLVNKGEIWGGTGTAGVGGSAIRQAGAMNAIINTGLLRGGNSSSAIVVSGLRTLNLVNSGTILGGDGGISAAIAAVSAGAAVNITNSGTIKPGAGSTIAITTVGNGAISNPLTLELQKGSVIEGTVTAGTAGTDVFRLGGDGDDSFDISTIGSQYRNFDTFQKTGNSTWSLTGAGTVATPWMISAGTLQLGDGASMIGNVTDNATLAFNNGTGIAFANTITGTGNVMQAGSGTTILSGTNTYQGGTTLNAGTLSVSDETNLGDPAGALRFNGGVLQITGSGMADTSRAINWGANGGGFDIVDAGNVFTVSQTLAGGQLTKLGGGTLVLTADNSLSGGTTIGSGTLQLGDGGTVGSITGNVADNGTLTFDRSDTVNFTGAITGSGALRQVGSGTTVLAGNSNYTGTTYITDGTLQVSGGGVVNGTSYTEVGTRLVVTGAGSSFTVAGDLVTGRNAGTATITVDNGGHLATGRSFLGEGSNQSTSGAINIAVDGTGSLWNAGDFVQLGAAAGGTATLTVSNGGVMTIPSGAIVVGRGGDGTALVTGAGSQIMAGYDLQIGWSFNGGTGNGQLTIQDGGLVSAANVALSYNDGVSIGNNGTLTVLGTPGARGVLQTASLSKGYDAASATFDGGILRASASSTAFLWSYGGDYVTIGAGGMFLDTNGFDVTASSGLAGPGMLIKQGTGTLTLTAANSYGGGTIIEAGTLQLGDGGTGGSVLGHVADNGTLAFNRSDAVTFTGAISGSGTVRHDGAGTTILTGANSYGGGTAISAGVLQLGDGGTTGSITGDVTDNGALVFDRADAVRFAGTIGGSGSIGQTGTGNIILTGVNTYAGGTTISAGMVTGSASSFGSGAITDNAALVIDQAADADFANAIDGSGSFTKQGAGRLNYTGTGTLGGPTTIAAGVLSVNGALAGSAVTVQGGGTLGGNGTVGAVIIRSGAIIAPGNSIGTLHIDGAYSQAAGSVYQVQLDPNSNAGDLIAVHGAATLDSGAGLTAMKDRPGAYRVGTIYTVLHADHGVGGTYTLGGDTLSPYLALRNRYDADNVYLEVVQTADPAGAAQTGNQVQTATGVAGLPAAGDVGAAVLNTQDAGATRAAFDRLSGDALASANSLLVSGSVLVRDTTFDRLRDVFCAAPDRADSRVAGCVITADRPILWAQGFGGWNRIYGNGNAAGIAQTTGGFLVGADVPVQDWRVGIFGGYSRSDFDSSARDSRGRSNSYHLGAYGGTAWGDLGLRLGGSYSWSGLATERLVAFDDFSNDLHATYNAGTTQFFSELGRKIALERVLFEPFANLAYVNLHTGGFRETGGAAALTSRAGTLEDTFATLGVRPSTEIVLGSTAIVARGMLGWRHTFGDMQPASMVSFDGGSVFTVAGVPIARDAGVMEAGLKLDLSDAVALGLTYGGQFSGRETDHSIRGTLSARL